MRINAFGQQAHEWDRRRARVLRLGDYRLRIERVYVEPPRIYIEEPYYGGPVLPSVVGLTLGLGAAYYWGPRYYGPRGYTHYRGRWHR